MDTIELKPKKRKAKFAFVDLIIICILVLTAFITIYPFIYTIAGSFSNGKDFQLGGIWLFPRVWTLDNYVLILGDYRFWISLGNTILRTVIGTVGSLLVTSLISYAMSHPKLPYKKFFRTFMIITMYFSGGIVPFFVLVKLIGLYDNFLVYILPTLYSVYNMIVISNFFKNVDEGIREAARIDGANEFQIWFKIYLPISFPVLVTVGMWVAVMNWNSYLPTLLYTNHDVSLWTLQYYILTIVKDASLPDGGAGLNDNITAQTVSFAAMVLSMLPIALIYPIFRKKFSNSSDGASKE